MVNDVYVLSSSQEFFYLIFSPCAVEERDERVAEWSSGSLPRATYKNNLLGVNDSRPVG